MRHRIAFIFILTAATPCFGQMTGHFGTGVSLKESCRMADIHIGHGFSCRWSAESSATFLLPGSFRNMNEEWEAHDREFETVQQDEEDEIYRTILTCGFRYWNRRTYEGCFIHLGILLQMPGRTESDIGAGYCIKIRKHLGITILYTTGRGLGLTMDYLF